MDHGKRGTYRLRGEPDPIDLGNEPPLSVDGGTGVTVDRRRISAQWFSGTILTGLCGAALMGGAVFTSLDGEAHFAAMPERSDSVLRGAIADRTGGMRKGDRLPPPGEANGRRHVLRDSITSRVGNREVVRVRPFISVAANLSLTVSELSANIPPFNPQKMLADSEGAPVADAGPAAAPDAEVSFVQRDLASLMPRMKVASLLPVEEVIARVRESANWAGGRNAKPVTVAGIGPTGQLAFAPEGNPDPYAGFEARIVPENITLLPKTAPQTTGGNPWNERIVTVKKGESISTILRDLGAAPEDIRAVASALGPRGRDGGLKEGHKLRMLLTAVPGGPRQQPVRVIVANETVVEAVVALSDLGKYVAVDVSAINSNTEVASATDDDEDDGSGVRLYQSIYETALRNNIPRAVIDDMIRVYSYDVDFQRRAQAGDSFEVLYAGEEETPGAAETKNDVLFASLTVGGETKKFYRFQTPDDNVVDYYDETGKSAKKFLVRKPLSDGIMRSGFGVRRHPILGYMKMHTGVDWTAPHGTPIFASGNGIVDKVGWESGYGKYIKLRHANGYETAYGHMTAYARGIDEGKRVRQGQIIGFVGSTGLSTGSHLHYEILVNGRFVDPMRIRLPRGRVLEAQLLTGFEKERDRLDTMISRVPTGRVAQSAPEAGARR